MAKICLNTDIVDGDRRFQQGLIGRIVMSLGYTAWLVEFKYPDFHYPNKSRRLYAEVKSGDFEQVYEAASEAQ